MSATISVPISTEQFLELVEFLKSKGDPRDPVAVIALAVEYWMDNASWKPELISPSDARGYQWKNLFLPDGTQIRMQYKGAYHYAKVEGDAVMYEGKRTSPGALANTIARSSRNAWRDLWIKRPKENAWTLADDCRKQPIDIQDLLGDQPKA